MYRIIKRLCDCKYGIITQCLLADKAKLGTKHKGKPASGTLLANVAVEVNQKLGGTDRRLFGSNGNVLPVVGDNFMVVGVDVCMPTSNNRSVPTVGGVAASMDR